MNAMVKKISQGTSASTGGDGEVIYDLVTKKLSIFQGGRKKNLLLEGDAVGINYSTSEQNTGLTWIDGKPIYQKTYNITSTPFTDNLGLETIVNTFCYADTVGFGICPFVTTALIGGSGEQVQSPVKNIAGSLSVDYTGYTLNSGTLTIQYTKL